MDDLESSADKEPQPPVEIEVDPFESIVDDVVESAIDVLASDQTEEKSEDRKDIDSKIELKLELECEFNAPEKEYDVPVNTVDEKPKKKRGRPKKSKSIKDEVDTSDDDAPLKRRKDVFGASDVKSENSQVEESGSRRSHRSKRPSSFITKYDSGSGSDDDKLAFKGSQLSDDDYTPEKETQKGKRGRLPLNGNSEISQDGLENIKIESVSSIKKHVELNAQQMDAASFFLSQIMKSTSNLGAFIQSKSDEFISTRLASGFITDTNKLQFCMEKSFKLLELIKSNLKAVEVDLKQSYTNYIKQNKLEKVVSKDKSTVKFLSEHKIRFSKDGAMSCPEAGGNSNSDSDCEIVAEIPSTPKKSLDILRRVEKNGISWRAKKGSISSQCSDGSTKILIPGQSTIFLNKNIKVKKVPPAKPQFESFFHQDGRTLKPPDLKEKINKCKIRELEKTTLILGWLDLAYRKVSKQFYNTMKQYERKLHYESCSDLGESCSDDELDSEWEHGNTKNICFTPKNLSSLCLSKINEGIHFSNILLYQMLEMQFQKYIAQLEKNYSLQDEILVYPDSLLKLCVSAVNSNMFSNPKSLLKLCVSAVNSNMFSNPKSLLKICADKINNMLDADRLKDGMVNYVATREIDAPIKDANIENNHEIETCCVQEKDTNSLQNAEKTLTQVLDINTETVLKEITPNTQDIDLFQSQNGTNVKTESSDESPWNDNDANLDAYESEVKSAGEDPMLQVTHEIYLEGENQIKSKKALRDLLQSSSSDEAVPVRRKKKRLVKRIKKKVPKDQELKDEKDPRMSREDWMINNHLLECPKLKQMCRVNLTILPHLTLKPYQDVLKNVEEDTEMDKLLDFSTLVPRSKSKSDQDDDEDAVDDSSSNQKNVSTKRARKKISKISNENNLLDLLTSGVIDSSSSGSDEDAAKNTDGVFDDDNDNPVGNYVFKDLNGEMANTEENANKSSVEAPLESIEKLAQKHKEKSNISAKNLLIMSSSSEESSDENEDQPVTPVSESNVLNKTKSIEQKSSPKKLKAGKLKVSEVKMKSSGGDAPCSVEGDMNEEVDGEVGAKVESLLETLLTTPIKEPKQAEVKESPKVTLEDLIQKAMNKREKVKNKRKSRKKLKIVTESDEERKKFQKKKRRLVRNEERKNREMVQEDSSDNDSVLTLSSAGTESSSEETMTTYQPSSQRPNDNTEYFTPIIKRETGFEHTPKTPRTKNRLAQKDLLNDSSEDDETNVQRSVKKEPGLDTGTQESVLEATAKGRKKIRDMLQDDNLLDTTKMAAKEEEQRLLRLSQKNTQLSKIISHISPSKNAKSDNPLLILDVDVQTKKPLLSVHPALVKIMKEHQIDGVKFMWDTCFESVNMVKNGVPGGGCILAHCMGLGKSLQVVSLIHTLLASNILSFRTVLICCPLSTVLNWADEFKKWLRKIDGSRSIKVYELSKYKKHYERSFHLEDWHKTGGVFIMGYEMFRLLTSLKETPDCKSHVIQKIHGTLLAPGPDIVVCDEGHLLKNDNTTLAKVMNKIRTRRRIVLTGTPLQNNLREYYCMVNFVKPNLLGSRKEYSNRFENPIQNGQHRDSSVHDIKIMKKRSHVLHKMLEGCVQRKEATLLYKYLPRKREYVLLITLSECQIKIYRHYLSKYAKGLATKGTPLLKDFHTLQKVWTHPRTLHNFFYKSRENKIKNKPKEKVEFTVNQDGVICLEDVGDVAEETLAAADDTDWWMEYVTQDEMNSLECSPKFTVALQLLEECLQAGDKMLIFSTSLFTLDAMEFFLQKIKDWTLGKHYYRLDGSVTLENRQKWCRNFNSERNKDVKLFLISTRAGGLGINMIAANRVIIMDVSWNPSHDIQSIFRVYRFGQKKDCYIYRLVAMGTMEEKIYERSVTKQAISLRVVDEQQIDRHYNTSELSELYTFNPVPTAPQPVPSIPSDGVLAAVLSSSVIADTTSRSEAEAASNENTYKNTPLVWSVHEHDSLLRDLRDEQLPEEERVAAWLEYQAEREQQKIRKEKARQANSSNCIIPDIQMPFQPIRPQQSYFVNRPPTMWPLRVPLARGLSMNNSVRSLIKPHTNRRVLGSYSTLIQQLHTTLPIQHASPIRQLPPVQLQTPIRQHVPFRPRNPQSNASRPYIVQSSSYAVQSNEPTLMVYSTADTPQKPSLPKQSQNSQTQGDWALPSTSSNLYNEEETGDVHDLLEPIAFTTARENPVKAAKRKRSPKKRSTPKKAKNSNKTVEINHGALSDFDNSNTVYFNHFMNGYNSSEAESIVPDLPVVTIDLD